MKAATVASLMLLSNANNVPIQKKLPGWQMSTPNAEVSINVFVDLLCPDSMNAYHDLKTLLPKPSPVAGKTYK